MTSSPKSRLIVGCGYLGRRVAQRWVDAGDRVHALTRSVETAEMFQRQGIHPVIGDVLDPNSLLSLPSTTTLLYSVGHDRSSGHTKRRVYLEGLRNVLCALPTEVERFLYISSTSVYGQNRGEVVDESSPCEPSTEGGTICLDAEQLADQAAKGRFELHVLRLAGIYGPDRLIGRREQLENRQPFNANPDGWLNLIHVDDAAAAVRRCAELPVGEAKTTLVSDDRPLRRREFYESLSKLTFAPPPVFTAEATGSDNLGKRCSNRRLREELGVELRHPTIQSGLPDALGRSHLESGTEASESS